VINLEDYKNYLVSVHKYPIDNNEKKRLERMNHLNKSYSDDYLNKIINDTYSFIKDIFDKKDDECNYYSLDLDDDTTCFISLNLTGGWFSDRLYIDPNGNVISVYILHKVFGNQLSIWIKDEEIEFNTDDSDILSFDYRYSLYIQNFPKNMLEIKEELFGKEKIMKK